MNIEFYKELSAREVEAVDRLETVLRARRGREAAGRDLERRHPEPGRCQMLMTFITGPGGLSAAAGSLLATITFFAETAYWPVAAAMARGDDRIVAVL